MTVRIPRGLSPLRARERKSAAQARDILERRLGRIARAEREVLQLRLFSERSLAETARATHRSIAEVRALQYGGLRRLNTLEGATPVLETRPIAAGASIQPAPRGPSTVSGSVADRDSNEPSASPRVAPS